MKKLCYQKLIFIFLILVVAFFFVACQKTTNFNIEYYANEGGSIIGELNQVINKGNSGTEVTAVADDGYIFIEWSDGLTAAVRQEINVQSNISVSAFFSRAVTINYSAGFGGSISGKTSQTILYGASAEEVRAVPDAGYRFASWSDGVTTATRQDNKVIESADIVANFEVKILKVNYLSSPGGSIEGETSQDVRYGDDASSVTAVPDKGYKFVKWSDGQLTATRQDLCVTSTLGIVALFEKKETYSVRYSADNGGFIIGLANQTVAHEEYAHGITAMPKAGYVFVEWSDGLQDKARTDLITNDLNVTATFRFLYAGGVGIEAEPFLINSYEMLYDMTYYSANAFKLACDLDLTGKNHKPIFDNGQMFNGSFDGDNHIIKNMFVEHDSLYPSFFGRISLGNVKNLEIVDFEIIVPNKSQMFVGAVCGDTRGALENIAVKGSITVARLDKSYVAIGGLAGRTLYSVARCSADVSIDISNAILEGNGDLYVGGLLGWSSGMQDYTNNDIISCNSKGNISLNYQNNKSNRYIGGLVGYLNYDEMNESPIEYPISGVSPSGTSDALFSIISITDCYSEITIDCNYESICGGLIGGASSFVSINIADCYATGNITVAEKGSAGGLIAELYSNGGLIDGCYATGNITAQVVGGLIADINSLLNAGNEKLLNIVRCYTTGKIICDRGGGLCYSVVYANFYQSYSTSDIYGESEAAGFIFYLTTEFHDLESGNTQECFSSGDVVSNECAIGFIAYADGVIKNCYSIADVYINGINNVSGGGLVYLNFAVIFNCYYAGKIYVETDSIANSSFGVVASHNFGKITNCHWLMHEDSNASSGIGNNEYGEITDVKYYGDIFDMYSLAGLLNTGIEIIWINTSNSVPQFVWLIMLG